MKKAVAFLFVLLLALPLAGCSSDFTEVVFSSSQRVAVSSDPMPAETLTSEPTPTPTPLPTEAPTPEPTPKPTPSPTPSPTAEPTPQPEEEAESSALMAEDSQGGGKGSNFDTYDNPEQQQTEATFVLNTNSKKFHDPGCKSVKKIAPKNYATSSSSASGLIAQGYSPCKNCHPG